MSNFAQFIGGSLSRTPTAIVNGFSSGSPAGVLINAGPGSSAAYKSTLSGALTATTLATMLSITGGGVIHFAAVSTVDATARTLRLQLILDGTTVFDSTSASISTANNGIIAVGEHQWTSSASLTNAVYQDIPFSASCVLKIASSLTETDKVYWHAAYRTV